MSEENKVTLEERVSRLEGIIEQMEDAESTLDASFELYKQGLTEIKAANEMLDNIEKAMMVINLNGELEEF